MSDLTATLTFGDLDVTASPVTIDHYEVTMTPSGGVATSAAVAAGADAAVFPGVEPGDYVFSAQAFDTNGNSVGPAVTTSYTVAAPAPVTITVKIPVSIAVAAA
jgi:hypothetical protein